MNAILKQAVPLGIILSVPLVSYYTVFRPQNERITEVRHDIEEKEMMLEKLEAVTSRASDLATANGDIERAVIEIESRLPGTKEVDVLLEQVADLALASRLELRKVKAGTPAPSSKYREQPLEMKVEGDFESFYTFLVKLETLDRLTRMPDMTVKRLDKEDGALEATFTLSIYFQPEVKQQSKEGDEA